MIEPCRRPRIKHIDHCLSLIFVSGIQITTTAAAAAAIMRSCSVWADEPTAAHLHAAE
jgi:hypothetical protein